jgi:hypothetical protein
MKALFSLNGEYVPSSTSPRLLESRGGGGLDVHSLVYGVDQCEAMFIARLNVNS